MLRAHLPLVCACPCASSHAYAGPSGASHSVRTAIKRGGQECDVAVPPVNGSRAHTPRRLRGPCWKSRLIRGTGRGGGESSASALDGEKLFIGSGCCQPGNGATNRGMPSGQAVTMASHYKSRDQHRLRLFCPANISSLLPALACRRVGCELSCRLQNSARTARLQHVS